MQFIENMIQTVVELESVEDIISLEHYGRTCRKYPILLENKENMISCSGTCREYHKVLEHVENMINYRTYREYHKVLEHIENMINYRTYREYHKVLEHIENRIQAKNLIKS